MLNAEVYGTRLFREERLSRLLSHNSSYSLNTSFTLTRKTRVRKALTEMHFTTPLQPA